MFQRCRRRESNIHHHIVSTEVKFPVNLPPTGIEVVGNFIKAGFLLPSLVLLGCGTIPMGVDPLPYYSIDEKDQAIHTRELCLLYRTHGFVAKSNTCEGSWEFEHERIKSAYDTPAKEQEKVQEYKIEAVLKLKRGSEEIHEVTTSIADAGSTREEAATANMSTDRGAGFAEGTNFSTLYWAWQQTNATSTKGRWRHGQHLE